MGMSNGTRNDGAPEAPANAATAGAAATGTAPAPVVRDVFATDEEDSGNTDARTEDGQTWARRYVTFERVHVTEHALAVLNQDNGGDSDRCRELKQNLNRTCAELESALAALERGMDLACVGYPYSLPGIFGLYTFATNNMGVSSSNSATAPQLHLAPPLQVGAPLRALNTGLNDVRAINWRLYALLEGDIKNGRCRFSATWFLDTADARVSIVYLYLESLDTRIQVLAADLYRIWPIPGETAHLPLLRSGTTWQTGRYPPPFPSDRYPRLTKRADGAIVRAPW